MYEKKTFDPNLICPLCCINNVQHDGKKYISCEQTPPKCVFIDRDKYSDVLIEVPSCKSCNNGTSKHDEKFKYQLSIQLGVDTSEKKKFWDSCRRTLRRQSSWRNELIKKIDPFLILYRKGYGYKVKLEVEPTEKVITKIVRGLHWKVTTDIIPAEINLWIRPIQQGHTLEDEWLAIFNKFGQSIQKCGNQFEAIHAIPEDCRNTSAWLLRFYGQDCFLVILKPS